MKLLYITNGITGSGGLERVLSVKASWLAEHFGYEVHIGALNEPADKKTFFEFSPKIIRHTFSVGGNPLSYIKSYKAGIKQLVASVQPDIISVCDDGLKGFFVPKIIGKKIPTIYERHASVKIGFTAGRNIKQKAEYAIMQKLASDFSRFVVLTKNNLKEWNTSNLKVIPNPLPFVAANRSSLDQNTVISVGSLSYNKGTDLLLDIWDKVSQNHNDWTLKIFGKATPDGKYQQLAKEKGLKNISFEGSVTNIQDAYKNSSIFVLPSRSEGFGMVLIEAMNFGVPVISFNCPQGPADIITNGRDGFLIENGDVNEFAEKLQYLMSNVEQRKVMGTEAIAKASAYTADKIVEQWDRLFKSLTP